MNQVASITTVSLYYYYYYHFRFLFNQVIQTTKINPGYAGLPIFWW